MNTSTLPPRHPNRHDGSVYLNLIARSPIAHGIGSDGGEQVLRTETVLYGLPGAQRRASVPVVSGAAVRARLREHAVRNMLSALGLETIPHAALRLLVKGGKLTAGGASVSLARTREIRELCPPLSVFGALDDHANFPGRALVGFAWPVCQETLASGSVTRIASSADGVLEFWPEIDPLVPDPGGDTLTAADVRGRTQYYRHDVRDGSLGHMLDEGAHAAAAEAREQVAGARATKGARRPDAETRRTANESMPHAFQTILAGTRLQCQILIRAASPLEVACLLDAVLSWSDPERGRGGLGGANAKGHGFCDVAVTTFLPTMEPELSLSILANHYTERGDALRAWIAGLG